MASPKFKWFDKSGNKEFLLKAHLKNHKNFYTETIIGNKWKPSAKIWKAIKADSQLDFINIEIERIKDKHLLFKNKSKSCILISADSVNASILYRQIPIPFSFAERNIFLTS